MVNLTDITKIPVTTLQQQMIDGTLGYCEPEYYIRQSIDNESVAKKKEALIFHEDTKDENISASYVRVIEPLIFYTDKNFVKRVLSGNTRIRSIMELLNDVVYKNYIFEDVPVREIIGTPTEEDLLSVQHVTNDYTQPHSVYDLAIAATKLKREIERKLKEAGEKNDKRISGAGSAKACEVFKIKNAYLSMLGVIANSPEFVHEYMKQNLISGDAVVTIRRTVAKDVTDETLKRIYEQIFEIAKNEIQTVSVVDESEEKLEPGTIEAKISNRHIKKYFYESQQKIESLNDSLGNPKTQNDDDDSSTPSLFTPDTTTASGSTTASTKSESNGGKKNDNEKEGELIPVDENSFRQNIDFVFNKIYSIQPEKIQLDHAKHASNLVKTMMNVASTVNQYFPTETNIEAFSMMQQLFVIYFQDPNRLIDNMKAINPEIDFSRINERINGLYDPINTLWDDLYNPKVEEVKEPKEPKAKKAKAPKETETAELGNDVTTAIDPESFVESFNTDEFTATVAGLPI